MAIADTINSMRTNISNAYNTIDSKGGTLPANKNLENLADAIDSISGGGGGIPDGIITGLATDTFSIDNSTVTGVKEYAFYNNKGLTSVNLPAVTNIGQYAFRGTNIATANFPLTTNIGNYSFANCSDLTSVNFPLITTLYSAGSSFTNCNSLSSVNLPALTRLGSYNFQNCTSLTNINLPSLTDAGTGTFNGCTSLENLIVPKLSTFSGAFTNCANLQYVDISGRQIGDGPFGTMASTFIRSSGVTDYIPYKIPYTFYGYLKNVLGSSYQESQITLIGTPTTQNDTTTYNITVPANGVANPYIFNNGATSLTIDWGDGSTQTITANYNVGRISHTYSNAGTYTITITSNYYYGNGTNGWYASTSGGIMGTGTSGASYVNSITFGKNYMTFLSTAFQSCTNLQSITFMGDLYTFPSGAYGTFNGCSKLEKIDFRNATEIPLVPSANTFANFPPQTQIIVPDALYDEWTTATNWVTIANQIVKASEV